MPYVVIFAPKFASNFLKRSHLQFDVFSTVHHSIELYHQPTVMHNFLYSLTICLLHYYPRHVSSINMPIFRRKIVFTQHLVSSLSVNVCTVHWLRTDCSPLSTTDSGQGVVLQLGAGRWADNSSP